MKHSEQTNEIFSALAKAQGKIKPVRKDGANPHLGNKYTTLDAIIDEVKVPLSENGLSFLQPLTTDDRGLVLETWLTHSSGQYLMADVVVSPMSGNRGVNEMQALGSSLTYLKRYALAAMLGVASEDDDDGNKAGKPAKQNRQPQPKKQQNGNGNVPTSPNDLLRIINNRVEVPYENVSHLFNAIRTESTIDNYTWPKSNNVEGWRTAYKLAKEYAEKKTHPQSEADQLGFDAPTEAVSQGAYDTEG